MINLSRFSATLFEAHSASSLEERDVAFAGGARVTAIGTCRSQREAFSFVVCELRRRGGPILIKLLRSVAFYAMLMELDKDSVDQHWCEVCPYCGIGRLHRSDYTRRPIGHPAQAESLFGWNRRYSLCCSRRGCRGRVMPPSVRFFGRRYYVAPMVTLATAMTHGLTGPRLARLREEVGLDRRTLERWRVWWREAFPMMPFWKALRGRFASPLDAKRLPASLVERFEATRDGMLSLLKTIMPVTTATCPRAEGRAM